MRPRTKWVILFLPVTVFFLLTLLQLFVQWFVAAGVLCSRCWGLRHALFLDVVTKELRAHAHVSGDSPNSVVNIEQKEAVLCAVVNGERRTPSEEVRTDVDTKPARDALGAASLFMMCWIKDDGDVCDWVFEKRTIAASSCFFRGFFCNKRHL